MGETSSITDEFSLELQNGCESLIWNTEAGNLVEDTREQLCKSLTQNYPSHHRITGLSELKGDLAEENSFCVTTEKLVLHRLFPVASIEKVCRNKHKLHDYSDWEADIPHEAPNVINSFAFSDLIDS